MSTGYGPSSDTSWRQIIFNGLAESYAIWETRFLNYLYTISPALQKAILPLEPGVKDDTDFDVQNKRAFAELAQRLDERSLHLVVVDANNNGRGALEILRNYYASTDKPRILTLYEELTTLRMTHEEDVTDYVIRAERAANGLNAAGENITDNLVIAMILKGLPQEYKPFVVIQAHLHKKKTIAEFKASLRNFANSEVVRQVSNTVMQVHAKGNQYSIKKTQCHACGGYGHLSKNCKKKETLNCNFCHKRGHVEKVCFGKKKDKFSNQSSHASTTFSFMASQEESCSKYLLVDCGETTHIVNSADYFTSFDSEFSADNHYIELADGTRSNELAIARGNAEFRTEDTRGKECRIILRNALLAPTFPACLFSVRAATNAGATISFKEDSSELNYGGSAIKFIEKGQLFFIPIGSDSKFAVTRTLHQWHQTLGHMNYNDILKLQEVSKGMDISDKEKP